MKHVGVLYCTAAKINYLGEVVGVLFVEVFLVALI
jgi:hypothetical protein